MTEQFISSPHKHDGSSVSVMMFRVCLALLPGLLAYVWFFGAGILIQCMLAVGFAIAIEYLMLKMRKRPVELFLKDGSAIVTGLLFALCLSPFTNWWITLSGIAFAIIIAKHLYGGLGYNPFNPAMAGYVFVLLCFPAQMNSWPASPEVANTSPALSDYISIIFSNGDSSLDALSGATALSQMKSQLGMMNMVSEIRIEPMFGHFAGAGWEWISIGFMLGGIGLLVLRVIKWQIPLAVLISMLGISMIFNTYDSDVYASPLFHLCSGGTLLCAFFIATDPVTASTTPFGRLLYGCLIGVLAYIIRCWGAYPDGIAFAVLLANACVPVIDHYTRPKVVGEVGS
ncbi:MAG: RnfABCDGE type electron transport complex subunit D [Gammaproteobacteria bacterium]|mgnify:CR=1 FL=1|jgi:Na+-translocating ferredoxin:NAD+ oxidoreductase subunit D|nr:RnfABCDGE type electron transport complex subunit D [Gammaproteobacteria bacterium]